MVVVEVVVVMVWLALQDIGERWFQRIVALVLLQQIHLRDQARSPAGPARPERSWWPSETCSSASTSAAADAAGTAVADVAPAGSGGCCC